MKIAKITQSIVIECVMPLDGDDEKELLDGQLPETKRQELEDSLRKSHEADVAKGGAKLSFFGVSVKVSEV